MDSDNIIYSGKVQAGKRVYFVDLKPTSDGNCYMVMSELRKRKQEDGTITLQKSRIFLYPEDLNRVLKIIQKGGQAMKKQMPSFDFTKFDRRDEGEAVNEEEVTAV